MKPAFILAVVTAYTVVAECSKTPLPGTTADKLEIASHVVAVDDRRPATALRAIDAACNVQAAAILVTDSLASANRPVANAQGVRDVRK
jgi:hypothetical protein